MDHISNSQPSCSLLQGDRLVTVGKKPNPKTLKATWRHVVRQDLESMCVEEEEAEDRDYWRFRQD